MAEDEDYEEFGDEEEEEDESLNNPDVVQKYRLAGEFANKALEEVVALTIPGAKVVDICEAGDACVNQQCEKVFNRGKGENKVDRGTAMPTCVSVNNIVCHFSPPKEDETVLKEGDVVRLDVGCHIDGYAAVACHTIVCGAGDKEVDGKLANVVTAAAKCLQIGMRNLRPGTKNNDVTKLWEKVAAAYEVNLIEGTLSHCGKRWILDGNECIICKPTVEHKVDELEFENMQVWNLDVALSTGPGKLRERDHRPLVYKRNADTQYSLKLKAGREVLRDIQTRFQTFPFTVRALTNRGSRAGILEGQKHDLVSPCPVLYEKEGEFVAQFKATVLIMTNDIKVISGPTPDLSKFKAMDAKLDDDVRQALERSLQLNRKKKKPKKKKDKADAPKADA